MAKYLSNSKKFEKKYIKCGMHKTYKKNIVEYIRTTRPNKRYKVDLIEISVELNMKNKFPDLHILIIFLNMHGLFW